MLLGMLRPAMRTPNRKSTKKQQAARMRTQGGQYVPVWHTRILPRGGSGWSGTGGSMLRNLHILPRSPISKAVRYCLRLWTQHGAYLYDVHLEIDNNLMEYAEASFDPLPLDGKTGSLPAHMPQPRTSP